MTFRSCHLFVCDSVTQPPLENFKNPPFILLDLIAECCVPNLCSLASKMLEEIEVTGNYPLSLTICVHFTKF